MIEEVFVHTSDGTFVPAYKVPGTKVRRKVGLPYSVHPHFPLGETREVGPDCGKQNRHQSPDRDFAHIPTKADPARGIAKDFCFHPYADTLEVVDD